MLRFYLCRVLYEKLSLTVFRMFWFLQMSAYYAPAFFAHLLGKCLRRRNPILSVMRLAIVVLVTFALMWWPYLYSLDAAREVDICILSALQFYFPLG